MATLGTTGSTASYGVATDEGVGIRVTAPEAGTITAFTVRARKIVATNCILKCCLYDGDDNSQIAVFGTLTFTSTSLATKTISGLSTAIESGKDYWLIVVANYFGAVSYNTETAYSEQNSEWGMGYTTPDDPFTPDTAVKDFTIYVTYTPAPSGYGNDVFGVSSANISKVFSVATGDISKVFGK